MLDSLPDNTIMQQCLSTVDHYADSSHPQQQQQQQWQVQYGVQWQQQEQQQQQQQPPVSENFANSNCFYEELPIIPDPAACTLPQQQPLSALEVFVQQHLQRHLYPPPTQEGEVQTIVLPPQPQQQQQHQQQQQPLPHQESPRLEHLLQRQASLFQEHQQALNAAANDYAGIIASITNDYETKKNAIDVLIDIAIVNKETIVRLNLLITMTYL